MCYLSSKKCSFDEDKHGAKQVLIYFHD
jgi:hypothetical protein